MAEVEEPEPQPDLIWDDQVPALQISRADRRTTKSEDNRQGLPSSQSNNPRPMTYSYVASHKLNGTTA
jgi:hypothetical protein